MNGNEQLPYGPEKSMTHYQIIRTERYPQGDCETSSGSRFYKWGPPAKDQDYRFSGHSKTIEN
jgi:hypothetical protein